MTFGFHKPKKSLQDLSFSNLVTVKRHPQMQNKIASEKCEL